MNSDLSLYHEPIGKLFPSISRNTWHEYKLSNDQVKLFHEQGYLAGIKILDDDQIKQLVKELDEIREPSHPLHHLFYEFHSNESKDPNAVLFHSLGHWRITEAFHDVLWNPAFVVPASQLFGDRAVRFWHDQLFCKPAYHGGVVAWHQDYSYWTRTVPIQHLSCWIGLDDANRENGCLCYIPKSHTWGLLDKPELAGDMNGLEKFLTDEQRSQFHNHVFIEMKKGHAAFHHPLLVHGSYENKSANSRRAFVLNVFADGTRSDSDQPMLAGVPPIAKGRKMNGQYFPILFDPAEIDAYR